MRLSHKQFRVTVCYSQATTLVKKRNVADAPAGPGYSNSSVKRRSRFRRLKRRRRFWRFTKFLWLAGGRWFRHPHQQPCLSARVSKMDRNRGDVLREIAKCCLENRFGVIANTPCRALAGLF